MIILYFQLFVDVLCDDFQIITHDAIFKELETNQLEMVDSQRNCYEKQKYNLYIRSHHYGADDVRRNILEKNMLQFLKAYIAITGSSNFKITSNICEKDSTNLEPKAPLEFFQNAWYYNQAVEEGYNTRDQIYKQYNYNIYRNLDSENTFEEAYINNNTLSTPKRSVLFDKKRHCKENAFVDLTLIDNCINTLEEYEYFYNEIKKFDENYCFNSSVTYIALDLTEKQREEFNKGSPWEYFINESPLYETKFMHLIDYLEKRTPFGKYIILDKKKSNVGKSISYFDSEGIYTIYDIIKSASIERFTADDPAISSFNCTISMSYLDQYRNIENVCKYLSEYADLHLELIRFVHLNIFFALEIFYTIEMVENLEEIGKKIFLIEVGIFCDVLSTKECMFTYSYYMHDDTKNVVYSFSDYQGTINKEMVEKHKKIVFLIQNLKTLLNRSFLHYNLELKLRNVIIDNILCVNYCKSLCSKKVLVPWNYENKEVSIGVILSKIQDNLNSEFKYVLYSYQLKQNKLYKDLSKNEQIVMFEYVTGLRGITGKYIQNESKQIEQINHFCLEISLKLDEYTQYHYLFLPIYEFRFATHKTNYENAILEFKNLLNNSKTYVSNELPPNIVDLYIDVINEFIEIKNIPLKTLLLYFYNLNDEKIDFLIYTIIAIKAKKSGCLANVYKGLTEQELDIYDKLKIPYIYDEIKLLKDSIYGKFFEDLHFKL
ncbi:hypothetical protein COBT_001306, partial [Conglomerata obtusa]